MLFDLINENVCKNVSSRPTGLFRRFSWFDTPLFTTYPPPAAPSTQLFFQSMLSLTLCSRLERFSTANNLSNLWCRKLQHVSTYAFCRWDDIFTQKGFAVLPIIVQERQIHLPCLPTPLQYGISTCLKTIIL